MDIHEKINYLKTLPEERILQIMDRVHHDPQSLEDQHILLNDGTKLNVDTRMLNSDMCPHGINVCNHPCPEKCLWVVKGEISKTY